MTTKDLCANCAADGQCMKRQALCAFTGVAAPKAVAPAAPAEPVAPGSWQHLETMMAHSAWDGALQLDDALRNIRDFAAQAAPTAAPTGEPVAQELPTAGALLDDYGSTELGYDVVGMPLTEGDKRLMRLITESLGNDHPAFDDLAALIATARSRPGPVTAPAVAQPLTPPAPVERQPLSQLTDDQIDAVTREQWGPRSLPVFLAHRAYARAIERELAEAWGVKLAGGADKGGAA